MTFTDLLSKATKNLEAAGISTARLDALVLIEDVTGKDRAWLLANPKTNILPKQVAIFNELLDRRIAHEPIAYIRGKTEFYGRQFLLTPAVLEPRPESEELISLLKSTVKKYYSGINIVKVADVGTGSGALGITAALEVPNSQVELLEIDTSAIKIAKSNVDLFTLSLPVIRSDLIRESRQSNDILICNLPYVPDDFQINTAALHEPKLAIFGGADGLDLYRKLYTQVENLLKKPLYILCESLPNQHDEMHKVAARSNYKLVETSDFIQLFRYEK